MSQLLGAGKGERKKQEKTSRKPVDPGGVGPKEGSTFTKAGRVLQVGRE